MGKAKKNLDDLKKELKAIKKIELKKIIGGKKKKKKWNNGCGGILPQ